MRLPSLWMFFGMEIRMAKSGRCISFLFEHFLNIGGAIRFWTGVAQRGGGWSRPPVGVGRRVRVELERHRRAGRSDEGFAFSVCDFLEKKNETIFIR